MTKLPPMDPQDIFDAVIVHQHAQGIKSMLSRAASSCAYRGIGGLKCAAGCLITDDAYDAAWEGESAIKLPCFAGWPADSLDLLSALQDVHDNYIVPDWPWKWQRVAERFNLDTTILNMLGKK